MKRFTTFAVAALAAVGFLSYIGAQQSGSGTPGGASFSTQYKASNTTFGGAGPGTSGQVLTSNGAGSAPTFQAAGSPTGAALTRVSDTNVTLTLGGTPATALLQATSITAGWTGTLAAARGGTDGVTPSDDNVMVGSGTVWQGKALTSCSGASSAVTYNTTTNAFGCNTISGGATQTTGSFFIDWNNACTSTPTMTFNYVQTGKTVTLQPAAQISCTGDAVTFNNSGSGTTVPVAIRPAVVACFQITATDAGTDTPGYIQITTGGVMFLAKGTTNCEAGNFTASGTRNFPAGSSAMPTFTYQTP